MKVLHDQHVHTSYSVDTNQPMEEYIKLAIEKGCSYFIMTDHIDLDYVQTHSDWLVDFDARDKEINSLQIKYPNIKILQGIELGYKSGFVNRLLEIERSHHFDVINLSVHEHGMHDFYRLKIETEKQMIDFNNEYLLGIVEAMNSGLDFDVLSHFDYCYKSTKRFENNISTEVFEENIIKVFKEIIRLDKTLEVNTKTMEGINDDNHVKYYLSLYHSLGGKHLTLSSDAHHTDRYMSSFEKSLSLIKEAGFDHLCYFIDRKRYTHKI